MHACTSRRTIVPRSVRRLLCTPFIRHSSRLEAQIPWRVCSYTVGEHGSEFRKGRPFCRGDNVIWTVRSLDSPCNATPIVLIHDFGCASGIWIENIDFLSARHPLYMFDVLGFGRSSRPDFNAANVINAETKFVESIEDWRRAMDLQRKFFIIGHGFGAYLATLYTVRYGQFIQKLILLDPWGFSPKPDESQLNLSTPFWIRTIAYVIKTWTSFSAFRFFGPLGN